MLSESAYVKKRYKIHQHVEWVNNRTEDYQICRKTFGWLLVGALWFERLALIFIAHCRGMYTEGNVGCVNAVARTAITDLAAMSIIWLSIVPMP